MAETADGNRSTSSYSKGDNPSFNSGRMDKTSFTSTIGMQNPRYALGLLQEETANNSKALHLVPVKTFFQMRQTYSYFDKGDKRAKAEDKGGSDDDADDLKRVTCKLSRSADPEKTKKARERSWQHHCKVGADEAWCETMIYPKDSPQSDMERSKIPLAQHHGHIAGSNFTSISPNEYFNDLISDDATLNPPQEPQIENGKEPKVTMIRGLISKKQIKKLPLLEQIKVFLKDSKVLPLHQLLEMLSDSQLTTEKVLRNLALCGVMLKGNWTLQSEMLYPPGFVSLINGVSSELMCKGRDYVLFKLMRNEMSLLNRQKISIITQLPVEETREVLESVAYLKVTDKAKVWDLLKPANTDFENRHPEIVHRQDVFWKAQEEKFIEMETEKSEKRTRKKSVRESKT